MGTILLVTGNADTMAALSRMLMSRGYGVIATTDASRALSILRQGTEIDAVVGDYVLPDMDTPRFFAALKKASAAPLPVILMNDHVDIQGYLDVLSHGAFDFLFKPIEPRELFRILKVAVKKQAERGSAAEDSGSSVRLPAGAYETKLRTAAGFQ